MVYKSNRDLQVSVDIMEFLYIVDEIGLDNKTYIINYERRGPGDKDFFLLPLPRSSLGGTNKIKVSPRGTNHSVLINRPGAKLLKSEEFLTLLDHSRSCPFLQ